MKKREPGTVRDSRIPIYDHQGNMRGHVGPHATSATVSRFIGRHGAKLGKKGGRMAWVGPKPPPPKILPKPKMLAQQPKPQATRLEISLRGAKGSVKSGDAVK